MGDGTQPKSSNFKITYDTATRKNHAMNKSSILRSVFVPIVAVLTLLDFKQKALGLVNESVTNSKSRRCSSQLAMPTSKVDVWNNVIDVDHLAPVLHEESSRIGLGHKVFSRTSSSPTTLSNTATNRNIIEETLDSILTELNDDSKYVEYWTRLEWRSIQAHADVDEYRAKQEQQSGELEGKEFRYPRNGHVLYLQVGSNVRGPTCVFPNRRSGGDLLRKIETESALLGDGDESCNSNIPDNGDNNFNSESSVEENDNDNDNDTVELVTVPAVPGRLLRFQGDYLHAVPRPTDFWLLKFVMGSPIFEPEEEWGRSVILFNTWDDEPPQGLPVDDENDEDNISARGNDDSSEKPQRGCNDIDEWSRATPLPSASAAQQDDPHCQDPQQQPLSTKIWILGDYRRREHKMQTVKLEASESLREALYQESDVMSTKLKIPS